MAGKAFILIKELVLDNLCHPCTCLEATFSFSKTQHFSRPTKCLLIKNPYSLLIFLFSNLALKGLLKLIKGFFVQWVISYLVPLLSPPLVPSPPPHAVFPVYNLTRSSLTAALCYLNAWNTLISFLNGYQRVIKRRMSQILLVSNSTELCTLKIYYRNYSILLSTPFESFIAQPVNDDLSFSGIFSTGMVVSWVHLFPTGS